MRFNPKTTLQNLHEQTQYIRTINVSTTTIIEEEVLIELVGGTKPEYGSEEAAGIDLSATVATTIPAHGRAKVQTGIKI